MNFGVTKEVDAVDVARIGRVEHRVVRGWGDEVEVGVPQVNEHKERVTALLVDPMLELGVDPWVGDVGV